MNSYRTIVSTLCATLIALTFTQCHQAPQPAPIVTQVICDSVPMLKIAYVDIDTLLTNYNLWLELNEEMIRKQETVNASLNEKYADILADHEDFNRKFNNNAFASRERAEAEQARILKRYEEFEALQERLNNELLVENRKNSELFRDSINAYVREYNKTHGYNIILSRLDDNILYVDNGMNITQDIINGLNARHEKYGKRNK